MRLTFRLFTAALFLAISTYGQEMKIVRYDGSDLQQFVNGIPDSSIVEFTDTLIYFEEVLLIKGKSKIEFRFNKTKIQALTVGNETRARKGMHRLWPRNRSHVLIDHCQNIELTGLTIMGPHEGGGPDAEAYVSKLEAQHGVEIVNSEMIKINHFEISNIYGDGIYIGRKSKSVIIENSIIHSNGRQGIAITSGDNVIIRNNNLYSIRRAHIDLEPNTDRDTVQNVEISGNTFGRKRLKWIAAASGKGIVRDVTVKDNLMNCPADIRLGNLKNASRQGPYYFYNNKSTHPYGTKSGEIWRIINVDGFIAEDNSITAQKNRNMYLIRTTNTKNVELSNNMVPNGNSGIKQ